MMEIFKGDNLQQFLNKVKVKKINFEEDQCKLLAFNLIKAVDYLHRSNIIHRDLKPANVLVADNLDVKICDFGLSRVNPFLDEFEVPNSKDARLALSQILKKSRRERRHSSKKRSLTPYVVSRIYRAPEIALMEPYSFSLDIWSLGCIVAELLFSASK